MGRLFWKFFVAILLAQVLATVGIGGTFWLQDSARRQEKALDIDTSPPAEMAIDAAAATLEFGGTEALRTLLGNMTRFRVYAVDETGRDLLSRVVKHEMLIEARYVLTQADRRSSVRDMKASDGHRYLLFMPSREHLNGLEDPRGPARMIFGMLPTTRAIEDLRGGARNAPAGGPRNGAGDGAGARPRPSASSSAAVETASGNNINNARVNSGSANMAADATAANDNAGAASSAIAAANAEGARNAPGGFGAGGFGPGGPGGPQGGPQFDGGPPGPGGPNDMGPQMQEMRSGPWSKYRPFIPLVGATVGSLLCAFLLAWYFSRPIRDLRLAFEAASSGDLAPRFAGKSAKRGDELHDLGRDFDRMTAQLRNLMDGQTRLLHDVSHELRSPLARLQAAIGLAHQQPDKVAASLTRIERESMRMDKLVGELLTLSRLEAGALTAAGEYINMVDLVEEIASDAEFEASASERHVKLNELNGLDTLQGAGAALVLGQADLLSRAIENVVRNAIKHSPVEGTVDIEMRLLPPQSQGAPQLRIAVRDRGPGVAESDLQLIFEPFFRGEQADKGIEGHGLGLAIAMHVITAHGGGIIARNRSDGGLAVDITLPLSTPPKRA